jgi:hypothetical protein
VIQSRPCCDSSFFPVYYYFKNPSVSFSFSLSSFRNRPTAPDGWTPSIYWNAPNVTSFPVAPGSWISLSAITAFDVNFLIIAIGTSLCMLVVFSITVSVLGERAENFLMKFDIFVTEVRVDVSFYRRAFSPYTEQQCVVGSRTNDILFTMYQEKCGKTLLSRCHF